MTITTTRCPRCSRPLLGAREVPLPVLVLVGGKADQARRAHVRRVGRPAVAPLAIHDRARCDLYLARVLEDCHGFVQHSDGTPVTAAERARIELDGRLAFAAPRTPTPGGPP